MSSQEGGRRFSNPNYRPEEWHPNLDDPSKPDNGLTGIPVIDASNEISKKMVIDSLTGCLNRRYFDNFKTLSFDASRRNSHEIAIIYVDLNKLKTINDSFGHDVGDEVICMLACGLKAKFRKGDEVVRMGGDEFIIICLNDQKDNNFKENLERKMEEVSKNLASVSLASNLPLLSFAYGVAVYDQGVDKDLDGVVKRADVSMYEKKREMTESKSEDLI